MSKVGISADLLLALSGFIRAAYVRPNHVTRLFLDDGGCDFFVFLFRLDTSRRFVVIEFAKSRCTSVFFRRVICSF